MKKVVQNFAFRYALNGSQERSIRMNENFMRVNFSNKLMFEERNVYGTFNLYEKYNFNW